MNLKRYVPLKLLKNISYPTYQLYCKIENKKTPVDAALNLAILETMSWLRTRLRDFEIPVELQFDNPEDFDESKQYNFKSFRINEGYIITVIFIKETNNWTLHLIEPDLGPDPGGDKQLREPVAGRMFETNISYRIVTDEVECGFKTVCSEVIGTEIECEVYRLAVVKKLIRNKKLGLKHILSIKEVETILNSKNRIQNAYRFMKNEKRQMPIIMVAAKNNDESIASKTPKALKISKASGFLEDYKVNHTNYNSILNFLTMDDGFSILNPKKQGGNISEYNFDVASLAKHCVGFAQVYVVPNEQLNIYNNIFENLQLENGGIRIIYPNKFYDESEIIKDEKLIKRKIHEYTKGKIFSFGEIKFINDARVEEKEILINKTSNIKDVLKLEEEKAESLLIKIDEIEKTCIIKNDEVKRLKNIINDKNKEIGHYKKSYELEIKQIKEEYASELRKNQFLIEHLKIKLKRPNKINEIIEWVEETFKDKLALNQRAIKLINEIPQDTVDMDILCDAIECIACEWRDLHMGEITEENMMDIMSEKYDRPFIICPSGFYNLKQYTKEYKIKLLDDNTNTMRERLLDWHLKVGINKNVLRIYFLFDDVGKKVIIGSLPKHLSIRSIKS